MSDPEPIDLSQLQNLNFAPDWVGDLQKRESATGEVIWGRAPESEREARGGGQGSAYGSFGGGRGPRRDREGGGGFGGGRPDSQRPGGGPRGPRPDNRGPRPGGPGGFGAPPRGPRPDHRGPRPDGPPGNRPFQGDRGARPDRPQGEPRGPRPGGFGAGPRPDGGGAGRPPFRRDDRRREGDRRGGPPHGHGHHHRFEDRPHIEPLPGWRVKLLPEPKSLEAIVRQIKASGRAYPVFELGRLFLAGRDRYVADFSRLPAPQTPKNLPKGAPSPEIAPLGGPDELFHVITDNSLWLNREEAIRHLLQGPALKQYYRRETISVEPPKGIFTAVAVCGFSGTILGPPNHHSFQSAVAKLHREQFSNLPLERYKSRIRTEKDPELVAKWLEQQSTATVYIPLTEAEVTAAKEAKARADAEAAAGKARAAAPAPEQDAPGASASPADTAPDSATATASDAAPSAAPASQSGEDSSAASPADEAVGMTDTAAENQPPASAPESDAAPLPDDATLAESPSAPAASDEPSSAPDPEASGNNPGDPDAGPDTALSASPAAAEPLKSHAAMEAHFIAHHAPAVVKAVSRVTVSGNIPGKNLAPGLLALLRQEVEQQQRFPMQLVQDLCRELEKDGLKFFKRDKKATFVCRTRPHFIEDESHLSPRLRSIIGVVKANPGITVPRLVSTLAPQSPHLPALKNQAPGTSDAAEAVPAETSAADESAAQAPPVSGSSELSSSGASPVQNGAPPHEEDSPTAPAAVTESSGGTEDHNHPPGASESAASPPAPGSAVSEDAAAADYGAPAGQDAAASGGIHSESERDAGPPPAELIETGSAAGSVPAGTSSGAGTGASSGFVDTDKAPAAPAAGEAAGGGTGKDRKADRQRRGKGQKNVQAADAPQAPLSTEELGVLQDLRWLVQEGFVTEYASGELQILGRAPQPPAPPASRKKEKEKDGTSKDRRATGEGLPSPGAPGGEETQPSAPPSGSEISTTETEGIRNEVPDATPPPPSSGPEGVISAGSPDPVLPGAETGPDAAEPSQEPQVRDGASTADLRE